MAHHIDESLGRPAFAFDEAEGGAWHGLGQPIPAEIANDPKKIADFVGAGYGVYKTPVFFNGPNGKPVSIDNRLALVRDDTLGALGVFSPNYREVQPVEYFEAFRDSLKANDLKISSAGVLKGGRIVFVNAKLDPSHDLIIGKGKNADRSISYACMGGGYDGSMSSFGYVSSFRTVCWNTLSVNLSTAESARKLYRVMHSAPFSGKALHAALGLAGPELAARAEVFNTLAGYKVTRDQVNALFCAALKVDPKTLTAIDEQGKPVLSTVMRNKLEALSNAYESGPGANLPSAKGTLYGALNAVTFFTDHAASARDTEGDGVGCARFHSAHFGTGARAKQRALEAAMSLAGITQQLAVAA